MSDDHGEAYTDFPTGILVGGLVLSFAVSLVLGIFVFGGSGSHGTAVASNTPPAMQQKK